MHHCHFGFGSYVHIDCDLNLFFFLLVLLVSRTNAEFEAHPVGDGLDQLLRVNAAESEHRGGDRKVQQVRFYIKLMSLKRNA